MTIVVVVAMAVALLPSVLFKALVWDGAAADMLVGVLLVGVLADVWVETIIKAFFDVFIINVRSDVVLDTFSDG